MNVLLIGMGFYQYEEEIKKKIEEMGHNVTVIHDAPREAVAHINFIKKEARDAIIKKHQEKIAEELSGRSIDCVITIVGRHLRPEFLKKLKLDHPGAEFILYLWDDVGRVENFKEVSCFYDRAFSFDPEDCKEYGFRFLPLFYIDRYTDSNTCGRKKSLFSAFFMHSDRMEVTRRLLGSCSIPGDIVIVAGFRRWLLWNLNRAQKKKDLEMGIHVIRKSLGTNEIACAMIDHTAVLDIQHPTQRGLTMRTFEALAARTKMVTTNSAIQYYDFYNPDNIAIIDRENPMISEDFLEKPYAELPQNIVGKYSLETWIRILFGEGQEKT